MNLIKKKEIHLINNQQKIPFLLQNYFFNLSILLKKGEKKIKMISLVMANEKEKEQI